MADPIRVSGAVSGTDKTLSFETGKLAPQSQGAVVATIGGTTVLTTANAAHDVRPGPHGRVHAVENVQHAERGPSVVGEQETDLVGVHRLIR